MAGFKQVLLKERRGKYCQVNRCVGGGIVKTTGVLGGGIVRLKGVLGAALLGS